MINLKFPFFFIAIFFIISTQSMFSQSTEAETETQKKIKEIENDLEESKSRLKKNEEILKSLKENSSSKKTDKYISPMKSGGLDSESMRNFLLMPEHAKYVRFNQNLWLGDNFRGGFMIRPRFEERHNLDFNNKSADEISRILQATQIYFIYDPNPYISTKITVQDARLWGGSTPAPTGDRQLFFANSASQFDPTQSYKTVVQNNTDIREAFMILKSPELPIKAIVGRQVLVFGDQRMIGGANWNTNGLSFDGVRFVLDYKILNMTAFGVKATAGQDGPNGILTSNGRKNGSIDDSYLYGLHNTINLGSILFDIYSFDTIKKYIPKTQSYTGEKLANDDVLSLNRSRQYDNLITTGIRITNRTNNNNLKPGNSWDYTIEAAAQSGFNGQRIYASWDYLRDSNSVGPYTERVKYGGRFLVLQTGYTFFNKLRAGVQYLNGSGDHNRTDGSASTFQTLPGPRFSVFPYWNSFAGQAENIGLKNLRSYSVNLSYNTDSFGTFILAGFKNMKDRREDAYYAISGDANTGNAGSCTLNSASLNYSTENCSGKSYNNKNYLGRTIFTEYDLSWLYYWKEGISFMSGASILYAGDSIRTPKVNPLSTDITSRYNSKPVATIFYFMVTAAF